MNITPKTIKRLYKFKYRKGLTTNNAIDIINKIDANYSTRNWDTKDLLEAIKDVM